eukprot:scaffold1610_cov257-Pinguiococcus_pyrenoidosus.AAC.58
MEGRRRQRVRVLVHGSRRSAQEYEGEGRPRSGTAEAGLEGSKSCSQHGGSTSCGSGRSPRSDAAPALSGPALTLS